MDKPVNAEPPAERPVQQIAHWLLIGAVSLLITLPLFVLVYSAIPRMDLPQAAGWRIDHILVFLVLLTVVVLFLRRFQMAVYGILILGLGTITITSLMRTYGFQDLRTDYLVMLHALRENTVRMSIGPSATTPFTGADEIATCIDVQDRQVRSFAVRAATTWFIDAPVEEDEFTLVQCFSIFKVINSSWTYVSDPLGGEYFAKASESVDLLAGDCDDHAILMAASIKAIGGEARLVRTTGHIYPEMKVGDAVAMERAAFLIRKVLFPDVARHAALFYHVDANGDRWINMDYTRHYPGGEVMNETIKGIMPV